MELPYKFKCQMEKQLGEQQAGLLFDAISEDTVTSIRFNREKLNGNVSTLMPVPMTCTEPVPWAQNAWYLATRPSFTADPLFHAGVYYVQEASSMFLEQIVKSYVHSPVKALDLCAAPGGKSTHLVSLLPKGSLLVSNEINKQRSNILCENIIKWGHPACVVTRNAPSQIAALGTVFDFILVDAPCSGEGMFRRDEQAVECWSPENVQMCAQRQWEIVSDAWNNLKPGGVLVYSTCTFNEYEDEQILERIVTEFDAESLPVECSPEWNITPTTGNGLYGYHFYQHKTKGEGLFMCAVRKSDCENVTRSPKCKSKPQNFSVPAGVRGWICNDAGYKFKCLNDSIIAVPHEHADFIQLVADNLYVLYSGIEIAKIKGKDVVPAHSLAVSTEINKDSFVQNPVDLRTALLYLQGNGVVIENNIPKGFVLLLFKNQPLGFVKNLGNRTNNLYPEYWKIRNSQV